MIRKVSWGRCRSLLLYAGCLAIFHAGACASGNEPSASDSPEAPGLPEELRGRLAAALAAEGEDYVPRTRHLNADGSPRFTNRLILESSPYLRQHAHNPVNWYPWGDEAFSDAARLGRPVLLSIGYSTCHWCHVMEEESFEDLEIASYLNANYIAIKVDREERPDLDGIYMSAVYVFSGRGGWPMTTWLTPEREPFFGGTYFPARDGDRGSRRGFLTLLRLNKQTYDADPDTVVRRAGEVAKRIRAGMTPAVGKDLPGFASLTRAVESYKAAFDDVHGGRRTRPKFPSSLSNRLLLSQHRRTGDDALLKMATLTLKKMGGGGMYDQVGGGFHRYSVDSRWLVPHFEKMLYDNALLTVAYLEGYQATGDEEFARIAREILRYVSREMTSPGGAFYSATDADSRTPNGETEEGWFFTWTGYEIDELLNEIESKAVRFRFGVTERGNFEGRNVLNLANTKEDVAARLEIVVAELDEHLESAREKLYEARAGRPAPLLDDKVLTSWNGLMISAMARGGFVLNEPRYVDAAARAADFVLDNLRKEGRLLRSFKDGDARHNGYLDDYAFLIAGLLDLHEVDSRTRWIREAIALQEVLEAHYRDEKNGGYFLTADDHERLLAREKPDSDGAEPSGNSIALMNLLRLHELTLDDAYRVAAEQLLRGFSGTIERRATSLSEMLLAVDFWLDTPKEVVIVTRKDRRQAEPLLSVLRKTYMPNKVVVVLSERDNTDAYAELVPIAKGKTALDGQATAYVCERGTCRLPTTEVGEFERQLTRAPQEDLQDAAAR